MTAADRPPILDLFATAALPPAVALAVALPDVPADTPRCRGCGSPFTRHDTTRPGRHHRPRTGSITMCAYCATVQVFDVVDCVATVRAPTDREAADIAADPRIRRARARITRERGSVVDVLAGIRRDARRAEADRLDGQAVVLGGRRRGYVQTRRGDAAPRLD